MAGLDSAIHAFLAAKQGVDARDKRGMTTETLGFTVAAYRCHRYAGAQARIRSLAAAEDTSAPPNATPKTSRRPAFPSGVSRKARVSRSRVNQPSSMQRQRMRAPTTPLM